MIDQRLLILGKLESHIRRLSRRTYVANLAMDIDDLIQEGRVKVLQIMRDYEELSAKELVSICYRALICFYAGLVRRSKTEAKSGIIIDLEVVYELADKDKLREIFVDFQLNQLYELFNYDEKRVLDCLIYPNGDLIELAERHFDGRRHSEIRITKGILAEYLGYSRSALGRIMANMRIKSQPVFG